MKTESDISTKLKKSAIYNQLNVLLKSEGDDVKGQVLNLIHEACNYAYQKSKAVIRHMPEFTLHDEQHIFNVLLLMEKIIPKNTLKFLTIPELMLLILTAFFHDIGMAPDEKKVRAWKKDWECGGDEFEMSEFERFERFCKTRPEKVREIDRLRKSQNHIQANLINEYLISEYIRENHAECGKQIIISDWKGKIKYKQTDITNEFAQLCFSHNQDASSLLKMDSSFICDDHVLVCLPFIGVILRLADLLDFDPKRTPSVLYSHLSVRNPISLLEWKKHRSINAWIISSSRIMFSAKCEHPAIEASIRHFCNLIDDELKSCNHVLIHIPDNDFGENIKKYRIPLPPSVDTSKIGAITDLSSGKPIYTYRDTKFNLNKNQVIDLLMGTNLYGSPEVALREIIQNSIDACLVRKAFQRAWEESYEPKIVVRYYTKDGMDFLEVEDNGIGMNQHIIDAYYSKIGSCYYKSREFYDLLYKFKADFKPISRFGIGVLSFFMVSDSIDVDSRRINDDQELDEPIHLIIEGYDSIFYIKEGSRKTPGTITKLQLRNANPWKRLNEEQFILSVRRSIPNPPFDIDIITDKKSEKHDKNFFVNLSPESLKRYDWYKDENLREISIKISSEENGFNGKGIVGVIEKVGVPVEKIEVLSKRVEIDDEFYELRLSLQYDTNKIEKSTTSIDVTDDGKIELSDHFSTIAMSRSIFSIHGIEFSVGLFPEYSFQSKKTQLSWPFPILLVLDISAPTDLDLNSARTEIIFNSKWNKFEEDLSYVICKSIFESLDKCYIERLYEIFTKSENENFKNGLQKAISTLPEFVNVSRIVEIS